jgi:hypothetical protein
MNRAPGRPGRPLHWLNSYDAAGNVMGGEIKPAEMVALHRLCDEILVTDLTRPDRKFLERVKSLLGFHIQHRRMTQAPPLTEPDTP